MEPDDEEFLLHNDAISAFNNELYANIFTDENIISKQKCITVNKESLYGYFLEKGKEMFFAITEYANMLPFKVVSTYETDYRGEVFKVITSVTPVTIPAEKRLEFKELAGIFNRFNHTNKLHQKLYTIAAITAYVDRVNFRVSTDAGFGKDSVANVIIQLVNSTVNLYGATFAKLEYVLRNKLIILNELGNLKKEELINMQEFLLAVGAYFNVYTKRTRKTNTTQEQYDISKLSLMLFYNLPEYYTGKAQEYFDQMFTKAVINRFIPFVFEGRLTSSFEKMLDIDGIMERNRQSYTNIIATLQYYRQHPVTSIKWEVDRSVINFPKHLMRYDRTFNTILKYVAEYSETQEEFDVLSKELFSCYKSYDALLIKEKVGGKIK